MWTIKMSVSLQFDFQITDAALPNSFLPHLPYLCARYDDQVTYVHRQRYAQ